MHNKGNVTLIAWNHYLTKLLQVTQWHNQSYKPSTSLWKNW